MVDKYTKVVLTLIATSLLILVMEGLIPKASALPTSCGDDKQHPCFVWAANPLWVKITQTGQEAPVRETVVKEP
jgi:hypothetical protein